MIRLLLAGVLALGLSAATAQETRDGSIERVITDQIAAFQADDFDTAFTFASPGIRRLFGSADRFGRMVRQHYPMVHRPGAVRFLDQREAGKIRRQRVLIRDGAGAFHTLFYDMIDTPGGWQIDGVQILSEPQVGA
ncbi:hypothetical protein OCGS_0407 [Oceaniovalibus guishaninsula JLT2003]|uniref:DUF4864 domain-containing protein n=1 Tax=Oceaniovalibus guishaninsula JLT2003 TaxID=1231392 RepID=K2HFP6_9RHOB|nr:DUF4864 domain-containing protein [Oceaniovalibus guishaninsula]EKE45317.1 hypothetical protein OCGS_0407 [Oceaniovalibus guishaninsula JLT2003]